MSNKIEIDTNYSSQTTCRVILKRLATQLQAPKINIENVNELLTQSISIISDYKINITKQIKMKKISKKTYIYANRYRINIEDKIALNMSSKLISQGMYKKAIENIYKVINKNESIKDITLFIKIWEERI